MKKTVLKTMSMFFAFLFVFSSFSAILAFADDEEPKAELQLIISSESSTVVKYKTVKMTASVVGSSVSPVVTWSSSDTATATVDQNGTVKGVNIGRAIITATAVVDGQSLSDSFVISVTTSTHFIKDYLEDHQVLSYQYSYIDDYYYTNDKDCWQDDYGFGRAYDLVAPYILLEYDYVRVFFTYEDKDWMIQLWKGQYGLLFYGSEMGIYTKDHSDEEDTITTFYDSASKEDWLKMEMTLYHDNGFGTYEREFSREYDEYWWCTGFKGGHLRREEPADELRMVSRITLKDEEMTKLFVEGLKDCGFSQGSDKNNVALDQFCVDGNDVYLKWQNISEAENTMPIKVVGGAMTAWTLLTVFWPMLPMLIPALLTFGVAMLILSLII